MTAMTIPLVEKEQAAESIRPIYDKLGKSGHVLNFFKILANKPDAMKTLLDFYQAVWAPGALSPKIKEIGYLGASLGNLCEY